MDDSIDGRADVARAAADLAERLPEPLAPLARLAYNYAWSWQPGGHDLWRALDAERFELAGRNPVRLLQESSSRSLQRAAGDDALLERIGAMVQRIDDDLARPAGPHGIDPARPVAFLCA
jgi:glycogen phosphorylase